MATARLRPVLLALGFSLLLGGCTSTGSGPADSTITGTADLQGITALSTPLIQETGPLPSATATPAPTATSAPTLYELLRTRQYLRDAQSDLLDLYQEMPTVPPEQRQRLAQPLSQSMGEIAIFMAAIEEIVDQVTTTDRGAALATMQRLQADLQGMQRPVRQGTPIPSSGSTTATQPPLPDSSPRMEELIREMELTRQDTPARMPQMDASQMQGMAGSLADVIGDLDELMGYAEASFARLSPEGQERIADQAERVHREAQQIRWDTATETATPPLILP